MNNIFWSSLSNIYKSVSQFLLILIVSRFIDPAGFGAFSIALLSIQLLDMIGDFGLFSAVFYKQELSPEEHSAVFWFNLIIGAGLFVVAFIGAGLLGEFYGSYSLSIVIKALAVNLLFSGYGRYAKTLLQKELEFRVIALLEIFAATTSLVLAIIAVYSRTGIYSLVISSTVFTFISHFGFVFVLRKSHQITSRFKTQHLSPHLKIGFYQFGGRLLDFLSEQVDTLLIGKFIGMADLGSYTLMKTLVLKLSGIVNSGLYFPLAAKLSKTKENLGMVASVMKSSRLIIILNIVAFLPLILFPKDMITIVYGSQYTGSAFVLRILAYIMVVMALGIPIAALQVAKGRTDLGFLWTVFRLVIVSFVTVYVLSISIDTFIITLLLLSLLLNYLYLRFVARKLVPLSLFKYYQMLLKEIAIPISLLIALHIVEYYHGMIPVYYGAATLVIILILTQMVLHYKNEIITLKNDILSRDNFLK